MNMVDLPPTRAGSCRSFLALLIALVAAALLTATPAVAAYNPITPRDADETITLDGRSLTIDEVVSVARYGAKVAMAPEALRRQNDAYELILEAARQDIPVYFFNRGAGANRETVLFRGDPLSPENRALLEQSQLRAMRGGARSGIGPEVADEEIVRAMMVVRLNIMLFGHNTGTPELVQMLAELLNRRVTPVVRSRGTPGEGDLPMMANVAGTMVGAGEAYYRGVRMSAREALARTGLQPHKPFARDNGALTSNNAYSAGQTALLLYDARRMLEWHDLVYAMALEGLNGNLSPLLAPSQQARPYPDQMWTAERLLGMLRGSYLFQNEPRIIQDSLSFRAHSQRSGAAWKAWRDLHRDLVIQMNSSDENPVSAPGWTPSTPELQSPYAMRFYVEGGGRTGYVFSNANWEATTWTNEIEAFSIAVAQTIAATPQRIERLTDTFFTVVSAADVLTAQELSNAAPGGGGYNTVDLMAEIQHLANPVPAQGNAIISRVEDMEAFGRQKVARSRLIVDNAFRLIAEELLSGSRWMNIRQRQDPERTFGQSTSAALQAFRLVVPWQATFDERPDVPAAELAYNFLVENPASTYTGVIGVPAATTATNGSSTSRSAKAAAKAVRKASAKRINAHR
jgi:histidine ammonia-lyase